MSKKGEIFAGLTSAVVTAALLGGAATFVYFYPLDYKQKTEKITEKPQTQEVVSKSEEKEVPTKSSNTENTSAPNSKITTNETGGRIITNESGSVIIHMDGDENCRPQTNESGSMIIHPDRSNTKIQIDKTRVFRPQKTQAEQPHVEPKKERPLSELKTLSATIDKKNKVLHVNSPFPTEDFKIKMAPDVTPEGWRKIALYIQFKGDKEPRNLLYNQNNGSALFAGDKVGNNDTPTLTVHWI